MKEVEILVKVLEPRDSALQKLAKFENKGIKAVHDTYFYDPLRQELQIQHGRLNESFRLRKTEHKASMTYKKDHFEGEKWLYSDEFQTDIENPHQAEQIIIHLGLKKLLELHNTKHVFETPEYEIVLEEVRDLGLFLEVEKRNVQEYDNISSIKKRISEFMQTLGISMSEPLNVGKAELLMQKIRK